MTTAGAARKKSSTSVARWASQESQPSAQPPSWRVSTQPPTSTPSISQEWTSQAMLRQTTQT
eukprot:CAMPEP_0170475656 /NCGR_PEP_ID=MMETSP0123-20130129/17264_1 /TAXON_ID=182087 /ORGANISM="Favella ehrenbergii, Strain Fehren 1" /LENGTH=61 /DNA_ID=CAMNT_0010746299 /DNA_START=27 /DNA_END=212 /DNA_ORIENTATION=+